MNKQLIRQALYDLERRFGGGPVELHRLVSATVDPETGEKDMESTVTTIDRVIILPAKLTREVVNSLPFTSANREFAYGGLYDSRSRKLIIDRRKFDGELKHGDWLIYNEPRYEIKELQDYEWAYILVVRNQAGCGYFQQVVSPTVNDV